MTQAGGGTAGEGARDPNPAHPRRALHPTPRPGKGSGSDPLGICGVRSEAPQRTRPVGALGGAGRAGAVG